MKRIFVATLGLAAIAAAPAVAADLGPSAMPVKAPVMAPLVYNWTGFYIGAHVGGGWSSKDLTDCTGGLCDPFVAASTDPSGFLGGVQAGFNYQVGQWVFGIEGQVSWADLQGDGAVNPAWWNFVAGDTAHTNVNMVATLAGRIGWAFDRTLLYVKGGVAFADEEHWLSNGGIPFTLKNGDTRTGWMIGAGVEYAFWNNWSAKIEYNFMDFGTDTVRLTGIGAAIPGGFADFDVDQQIHVVKFGINYRFGGPVVARY